MEKKQNIERMLREAQEKHPNATITMCGISKTWEECVLELPELNKVQLYYNVNKNTYTVEMPYVKYVEVDN